MSPEEILKLSIISVCIFLCGILFLVSLFFIANKKTFHKSTNKVDTNTNNLDNNQNEYLNSENYQKIEPKTKAQDIDVFSDDYLTNLYNLKYSNKITEDEFNKALDRYLRSKDDEEK